MARILLSAAGGPVIVGIVKALQAAGHRVIGIDADGLAVGAHFCDEFYVSPMAADAAVYLKFIEELAPRFDLFFPFIDEELVALAGHGGAAWKKVLLSRPETLRVCADKIKFQKFAEEKNLPVAPSAEVAPLVAKPAAGRGGKGIIFVEDAKMLEWVKGKGGYALQRRIRGVEYTVDILTDRDGKWVFGVARKRLRMAGVSVTGQVDMNENVLGAARRFVKGMAFCGPINIQVIEEEGSGRAYVIEINPRLSGSVEFTRLGGFDLVQASVDLFEGRGFKEPAVKDGLVVKRYWREYAVS